MPSEEIESLDSPRCSLLLPETAGYPPFCTCPLGTRHSAHAHWGPNILHMPIGDSPFCTCPLETCHSAHAPFFDFEGSCWWEQAIKDACPTRACCLLTERQGETGLFFFCLSFGCLALGFTSEKWNNVEMIPRQVATYSNGAALKAATFSPWRQSSIYS